MARDLRHPYIPSTTVLGDISVDIYANFTVLLADVHIDSGYLVVVTKEGSD